MKGNTMLSLKYLLNTLSQMKIILYTLSSIEKCKAEELRKITPKHTMSNFFGDPLKYLEDFVATNVAQSSRLYIELKLLVEKLEQLEVNVKKYMRSVNYKSLLNSIEFIVKMNERVKKLETLRVPLKSRNHLPREKLRITQKKANKALEDVRLLSQIIDAKIIPIFTIEQERYGLYMKKLYKISQKIIDTLQNRMLSVHQETDKILNRIDRAISKKPESLFFIGLSKIYEIDKKTINNFGCLLRSISTRKESIEQEKESKKQNCKNSFVLNNNFTEIDEDFDDNKDLTRCRDSASDSQESVSLVASSPVFPLHDDEDDLRLLLPKIKLKDVPIDSSSTQETANEITYPKIHLTYLNSMNTDINYVDRLISDDSNSYTEKIIVSSDDSTLLQSNEDPFNNEARVDSLIYQINDTVKMYEERDLKELKSEETARKSFDLDRITLDPFESLNPCNEEESIKEDNLSSLSIEFSRRALSRNNRSKRQCRLFDLETTDESSENSEHMIKDKNAKSNNESQRDYINVQEKEQTSKANELSPEEDIVVKKIGDKIRLFEDIMNNDSQEEYQNGHSTKPKMLAYSKSCKIPERKSMNLHRGCQEGGIVSRRGNNHLNKIQVQGALSQSNLSSSSIKKT